MPIILYMLLINFVTYGLYWLDKRAARRGDARFPEATLLLAGLIGGTLGAIAAQQIIRHKNRKLSFQFKFWALTVVQIALIAMPPAMLKAFFSRVFG